CMDGWPSKCLFNYDYQIVNLSEEEFQFLQACDANSDQHRTMGEILSGVQLDLERVRSLLNQQLIVLTPL
ncbi:MAG: SAM-dependent methyltransferase, partial [Coleofasciculus sp. C3-bin4]|nr:SAM-dependent methyltransferase [Coleofasciculus sp. C3-bin4]